MIMGTASGVGKTALATALCRIFRQDGYKAAPFKSQNMTPNTALTENGDEIAVSQMLQAHAAGAEPGADMNPLILKPGAGPTSLYSKIQVILNGRYFGTVDGQSFKNVRKDMMRHISAAYSRLASAYDVIVVEGAGSPVELNLKRNDIVNMGVAKLINAPVMLVTDIDRGGAFAALYGTIGLLEDSERKYIKAVIINRFKGDTAYFADGVKIIEKITGTPVAGVVPYIPFTLPEEDAGAGGRGGGFSAVDRGNATDISDIDFINAQIDVLAAGVRKALDMKLVYDILNGGV